MLSGCQAILSESLAGAFSPYSIDQIHGTIVGLEREPGSGLVNVNRAKFTARREEMDIQGFARALCASDRFPVRIRLGGFLPGQVPFTSRRQTPYRRSFSIQGDKAVVIGWPILACHSAGGSFAEAPVHSEFPQTLDEMRRLAGTFNIVHAYHRTPDDRDNDFYLRLGLVRADGWPARVEQDLQARVRRWLGCNPECLDLSPRDIKVASYLDESLPPESTRTWTLSEVSKDANLIAQFYARG
jgi:hypothetical protein